MLLTWWIVVVVGSAGGAASLNAVEYEAVAVDPPRPLSPRRGTLFRAGPGSERGDGMVVGVTLSDEGVICRARYVRSRSYGTESTDHLANDGCIYWNSLLFALDAGAKPYQMDPLSCATQKISELGGMLRDGRNRFDWLKIHGDKLYSARLDKSLFGGTKTLVDVFDAGFKLLETASFSEEALDFAPPKSLLTRRGVVVDGAVTLPMDNIEAGTLLDPDRVLVGKPRPTEPSRLHAHGQIVEDVHFVEGDICAGRHALRNLATGATWRRENCVVGTPTTVDDRVLALLHYEKTTSLAAWTLEDVRLETEVSLPHPLPAATLTGPFVPDLAPGLEEIRSAETLARLYARKSKEWNEIEAGFSGLGIKQFLFPKGVSGG